MMYVIKVIRKSDSAVVCVTGSLDLELPEKVSRLTREYGPSYHLDIFPQ